MFGLEDQKKKKSTEFTFELEKELKNTKKHQDIRKKIDDRLQRLKTVLRNGEDKENFDRYGVVLHGYVSLLKVMSRFTTGNKK